jgi:hypothetical protein
MLCVIFCIVVRPRVAASIMIYIVMPNAFIVDIIVLNEMRNVGMLNVIRMNVIMLNALMLKVIGINIIAKCHHSESCYA